MGRAPSKYDYTPMFKAADEGDYKRSVKRSPIVCERYNCEGRNIMPLKKRIPTRKQRILL